MTARYAVLGHPIAHSKSPLIHRLFAEQTGQDMVYEAIELPLDDFNEGVARLRAQGLLGMNVTVPFKFDAYALADSHSERASAAGAVNTLIRTDSGWHGDNTDGAGLVSDLLRLTGSLQGKHLLMLGAGGAASGVVMPLLTAGITSLTITNRTASKARELAARAQDAARVHGCGFTEAPAQAYDIIINATAASLAGELPPLQNDWFSNQTLAYDMMYGKTDTPFIQAARTQGAGTLADGLGMLVEQAAEAFWLWRGVRPNTAPILSEVRRLISV